MKTKIALFVLLAGASALLVVAMPVDARGGAARSSVNRGGGGASSRQASGDRASSASANRGSSANRSSSSSRSSSTSRSRDVSREVDRDVSIDIDNNGGCCYNDRDYHPIAAGMAIATTAAVIGSMVSSVPPSCVPVAVNGMTYQQCGSTWYQPQMTGSSTTYIVVNPP